MTDVSTVVNDVANTEQSEAHRTSGIRAVARIFAAANKRDGWQQFALFLIGLALAVPVIGIDILIMLIAGLISANRMSRRLAWIVEKTGVLFPAMGLALVVSILTFTVAPAKTIRTEIIKTIQASPAAASTTDDGSAEGN